LTPSSIFTTRSQRSILATSALRFDCGQQVNPGLDRPSQLHPAWLALLATLFTWGVTAIGAALVFLTRRVSQRLLDSMNGFAAGVMLAASYWSLLAPAIELSERGPLPMWLPATVGFVLGCVTLWGIDKILPHLHPDLPATEAEGQHHVASLPTAGAGDHAAQLPGRPRRGRGVRGHRDGHSGSVTRGGAGARDRHRAAELPRGHRGVDAAAGGGLLARPRVLVRPALGRGGTDPGCSARSPWSRRGRSSLTRWPSPPAP
jgi:hypothetical protein